MEPAKKANALVPATRRLIRHVVDFGVRAIDLLFPPRCLHCDAELPAQRQPSLLCEPCCLLFGPEAWLGCRRCGALQAVESCQDYGDCLNCHDRTFHFQRVIPLGAYEDALREAVLKAKRPAYEHLATALGHLFFQRRQRELREFRPDLIVPIPMFWLRRLHRQVNSADDCPHVGGISSSSRGWQSFGSCTQHVSTEGFIARGAGSQRPRGFSGPASPPPEGAGLACPPGR